jgi:hypothetical protein
MVNGVAAPEDTEEAEDIPEPDCLTIEKVFAVPAASVPAAKDIGELALLAVTPVEEVAT